MNKCGKTINLTDEVIYSNQLKRYGMTRHMLRKFIDEGLVKKVIHGIYIKKDKEINEFWVMGERYKNGIYSHNTALYFYEMTDRTPLKLDMTFPSNNRVANELLDVHYIKKEKHKLGARKITLDDNTEIQVYDLERTICDIIRDRKKLDPQVVTMALKKYVERKDKRLNLLYNYAKEFNIERILTRYMEVLI